MLAKVLGHARGKAGVAKKKGGQTGTKGKGEGKARQNPLLILIDGKTGFFPLLLLPQSFRPPEKY